MFALGGNIMEYRDSYYNRCGNCQEYEFEGDSYKGFCNWYGSYYYPDDSCSHQKNIDGPASGCYITTIVCDVLGYSDNCDVLENLRGLRDNVMQKDKKYSKLLMTYDVIGPQLANIMNKQYKRDKDKMIALNIYQKYLVPAVNLYKNKQYDESIKKYIDMIEMLGSVYAIDVHNVNAKDYDYSKGGHGKVYKLVK